MSMLDFSREYKKSYLDKTRQYFIENYLSLFIPEERTSKLIKVFPRQVEYLKSLTYNRNTIATKHRQAGVSTLTALYLTAEMVFANKKSPITILTIGNKLDLARQIIEKMVGFLDQVPRWFWGVDFYHQNPEHPNNKRDIFTKKNQNEFVLFNGCKAYARSSGEHAARGISSVSHLIFDEAAFIQNGVAVYAQAVAATAAVADSKIIMISTPNGKDPLYYKTYSQAIEKKNNYNVVEFKWFQDPRYNRFLKWYKQNDSDIVDTNAFQWIYEDRLDNKGNIPYNEEKWRELEKNGWKPTSPWYEEMCKSFNNDLKMIAQELEVSFLGSSNNVVPVDVIEAHAKQNVIEINDKWHLKDPTSPDTWIWKLPIDNHRYICAVDNSSGDSDDYTAIQIFDVDAIDEETNMPCIEQVLEYQGKILADETGELVLKYAKIYNQALVVVEDIGGYGTATILHLMNHKYPNLYYDDPGLKTITVEKKYSEYNLNKNGKLPGFHTSSMRSQMTSHFVALLKENTFRVRSQRLIKELETWVWKNGRPDHAHGSHDDLIMCLAMGLFVMEYSLFKLEKEKTKDKSLTKAWVSGNSNTKTYNTDYSSYMNQSIEHYISKEEIQERKNKNTMSAMMILGGFRIKR